MGGARPQATAQLAIAGLKDQRRNPPSSRAFSPALGWGPHSREPHNTPPRITLHGRMRFGVGLRVAGGGERSTHATALGGCLAGRAGGPVVGRRRRPCFFARLTRVVEVWNWGGGGLFVFLRVTCILLKSCELAKGNPFGNSGQGGWCLVLILFPCQQLKVFSQVLTTAILLFMLMILQRTVPLGWPKPSTQVV